MSDAVWALAFGYLTMITTWVLGFYLPRGRISKWAARHSVPDEKEEPKEKRRPR